MGAALAAGKHGTCGRLNSDDFDVWIARLQHPAAARQGAAGANAEHEGIDVALGVVPDFFGCGEFMHQRIGRVVELRRYDGIGHGLRQLFGPRNRARHAAWAWRQLKLGPEVRQNLAALHRHSLRHHEDQAITAGGRNEGEADAGVPGRRLHQNRFTRRDAAFGFQRVDHRDADAILDRRERIEKFEFHQNVGFEIRCGLDLLQFDEGRVADGLRDVVVDAAAAPGARRRKSLDLGLAHVRSCKCYFGGPHAKRLGAS